MNVFAVTYVTKADLVDLTRRVSPPSLAVLFLPLSKLCAASEGKLSLVEDIGGTVPLLEPPKKHSIFMCTAHSVLACGKHCLFKPQQGCRSPWHSLASRVCKPSCEEKGVINPACRDSRSVDPPPPCSPTSRQGEQHRAPCGSASWF